MISDEINEINEIDETNKTNKTNELIWDSNSTKSNEKIEELREIFENITNNIQKYNYLRQCRNMKIPEQINSVVEGEFVPIQTDGGGYYTQWYYYKSLKSKHMLIFETSDGKNKKYSGREIDTIPTNN